jgi:transposase
MKVHANAPLGPKGRATMVLRVVEQEWSLAEAAEAAGVSERTCSKWVWRYRVEGAGGLRDRSSAPKSIPHRTPEELVEAIAALRRLRMTGAEIALCLAMALSTVSAVLQRIGLGKLSRLEPPEPPNRYERRHPGELIHVDVKKLGRIRGGAGHRFTGRRHYKQTRTDKDGHRRETTGWEFVHVCVDDATRLAYVEVLADEKASTAIALPQARARVLRPSRHPRRAGDDRQRLGLPLHHPRARLPRDGPAPPAHTALPAAHQRQSRALHPDPAGRLGLRRALRHQPRTHRSP